MPDFAIASSWPETDASLLDTGHGAEPAHPIGLMPQRRLDWAADSARSAAPVDHAVQALPGGRPAPRWRINPAGFAVGRGTGGPAETAES